jgi:FtsZ-binding cell division protein ZapB
MASADRIAELKAEVKRLRDEVSTKNDLLRLRDMDIDNLKERNDRLNEMVSGDKKEIERLTADKRELIESILENLKMSFVSDRDTVLKNFPSAAKGYSRCLMLIDELITKYKEA